MQAPRSWWAAGRALVVSAAAAALFPSIPALALGPRDRHLTSARHGVSLEAPAGWTLSQRSGYGDTVTVLLHPDGGRITVTASMTTAADTRALFEQNRPGLVAQKLLPAPPRPGPRGFLSVGIASPGRPERVRQLYTVRAVPRGRQAVILTLVCREDLFSQLIAALDFVVERLELDDPVLPPSPGDNLPSPPLPGGSASTPPGPSPNDAPHGAPIPAPAAAPPVNSPGTPASTDDISGRAGAGGSAGQLRPGHRRGKTNTQDLQQR